LSNSSNEHKKKTLNKLNFAIFICSTSRYNQNKDKILDVSGDNIIKMIGGTGITPTDITIETIKPFLEKILPGFGEIFRQISFKEIGSVAILSRAIAGLVKDKVVYCIPGSPNAVRISVERLILPETAHIVKHLRE